MTSNMEDRLARIETLLEYLTEKLTKHQREVDQRAARVERTVYGDGNGHCGMVVRLDRLEQDTERRVWRERAVIITVLGMLVKDILGS